MEFPELGQNCTVSSCKQLDFLPVQCDACQKIFCKDHFSYTQHDCSEAYKKDNKVPVCPLCNCPISVMKGELPDTVVGRHIDNDCQSDTAQAKRKVYSNRCSLKSCKQKELIPFKCDSCHKNYCIRHRLTTDHSCQGFEGSGRGISQAGASALARHAPAAPSANIKSKPQATAVLTSQGRDLDRQRQERRQLQSSQAPQPRNLRSMQSGLSEDEAMARAIAASLSNADATEPSRDEDQKAQEAADAAFAKALFESEQEARNATTSHSGTAQRSSSKTKGCIVS